MGWTVYVLKCPEGNVRYVGVTRHSLERRLSQHMREAKANKTYRHRWLNSLTAPPKIEMIETTGDWDEAERRWIKYYRDCGARLVNGNEGGKTMSHATRLCGSYPAIRKVLRNVEGALRAVKKSGRSTDRVEECLAKIHSAIDRVRARGPESMKDFDRKVAIWMES